MKTVRKYNSARGKDMNISLEEKIKSVISSINADEFEAFGLRVCEKSYTVGETCDNSHELYQDPQYTDETCEELLYPYIEDGIYAGYYDGGELNGACAIGFDPDDEDSIDRAIEEIKGYLSIGRRLYIVAGDYSVSGNDYGEVIIEEAKIMAVIEL